MEANRNFANKIWNAGRFVIGALEQAPAAAEGQPQWTLADSWIWARLQNLIGEVERLFQSYQYGEAGRQVYEFFWSEFADWYVEIAKLQLAEGGDRAFYTASTLVRVLDACLRLLHPFTPYVTEELWGRLKQAAQQASEALTPKGGWEEALIVARWPEPRPAEGWEDQKIAEFTLVQEIVRAIRNFRAEKKIAAGKRIGATIVAGEQLAVVQSQQAAILALAHLDPERFSLQERLAEKPQGQAALVVSGVEIYLSIAGMMDVEAERGALEQRNWKRPRRRLPSGDLLNSPFAQRPRRWWWKKNARSWRTFQRARRSFSSNWMIFRGKRFISKTKPSEGSEPSEGFFVVARRTKGVTTLTAGTHGARCAAGWQPWRHRSNPYRNRRGCRRPGFCLCSAEYRRRNGGCPRRTARRKDWRSR